MVKSAKNVRFAEPPIAAEESRLPSSKPSTAIGRDSFESPSAKKSPKFSLKAEPILSKDKASLEGGPILSSVLAGYNNDNQWFHAIALDELARRMAEEPRQSNRFLEGKELEFVQKNGYEPLLQKKVQIWDRIVHKDENDLTEKEVHRFGNAGEGFIGFNSKGEPILEPVRKQALAETFQKLHQYIDQNENLTRSERLNLLVNVSRAMEAEEKSDAKKVDKQFKLLTKKLSS